MTAPSPVSLATLERLEMSTPNSPKEIPANTSLADLEQIRSAWLEQARAEQIPDQLFEIGRWLGSDTPSRRDGIHKSLEISGVKICVSIEQDKMYEIEGELWHMTLRNLWVYVNGALVLDWRLRYLAHQIDDEPDRPEEAEPSKTLFIPGSWLASALAMQGKAEAARIGFARNAETAERDNLARRLLVGMEV